MFWEFDIELLRLIHQNRVEALDRLLYFISYSASFVSIGIVLTLLIIALKTKSRWFRIAFYKILAVLIMAATVSFAIKNLVPRERPFKIYPDIEKLSEAGSSSFPSGHTLEAFAIAVALSVIFKSKKVIIPIFAWALLVAYTRMALGVHYPTDVIAGMITGSLIGWLIPLFLDTKTRIQS